MQSNKKITQLEQKMPRGSKKIIAKKTGLSYNTIVRYFGGYNVSFETESKIVQEATILLGLVKETNTARKNLINYELLKTSEKSIRSLYLLNELIEFFFRNIIFYHPFRDFLKVGYFCQAL